MLIILLVVLLVLTVIGGVAWSPLLFIAAVVLAGLLIFRVARGRGA